MAFYVCWGWNEESIPHHRFANPRPEWNDDCGILRFALVIIKYNDRRRTSSLPE